MASRPVIQGAAPGRLLTSIDVVTPIVSEGGVAQLQLVVADPDSTGPLNLTVDWGDGGAPEPFVVTGSSIGLNHLYSNDPATGPDAFTITLTLRDSAGAQATPQARSVTVNNVAPSLSISVSPTTFSVGATTTFSGTVSDAGVVDPHTVSIDWGDGSGTQEVVMAAGVTSIPPTAHVYPRAGIYTINASARDDDGGTALALSQTVTVFEVAPAAPSNLAARVVSQTQIDLRWADNSLNEDGFEVQRCNKAGRMCQTYSAPVNAGSYSDLTAKKNTTYQYSVRAVNRAGSSAYAGPVSATTPPR